MFRVPYRWLPRTILPNLHSCWWDVRNGLRNLWRWLPIVWFDIDWDWDALARVMEFKLRRMAEYEERYGHHVTSLRDAKRQRVCAELLRRLQADSYYENAERRFGATLAASHFAIRHQRHDQHYLGVLLGKYLTHWWD